MSLKGKTVLITGAGQRIGRALAMDLAREGANLVIHYHTSRKDAESIHSEIEALGQKAFLLQADLADPEQAAGLIERAQGFGSLFALVNNAAIFEPLRWENTTLQDWNRHMMVNLTAPFLLSQAFAKSATSQESRRIVNLLDWRALRPGPDHLPYTVSKSALAALTHSMAAALAPDVTVNGLALGAILPPSHGAAPEEILEFVPAGRWGSLEEVGKALIFLLDGPAYMTGEILHVDGGRHLV